MRVPHAVAAVVGVILSTAAVAPAHADQVRDSQWHLGYLKMTEVNRVADGDGVTVAVLDTGVDATQPDLTGAVLKGIDAWTPNRDGRADQHEVQHGTSMAALVAGRGHGPGGADGIRGIAPKANILPVGVWPPGTKELRGDNVAYGIRWAVDSGAAVICIAGGGMSDDAVTEAIKYAVGKGVPIVAAIGNAPQQRASYPGYDPRVLGVGSIGRDGNRSDFSVRDPEIDFVTPGADAPVPKPGGGYTTTYGTSVSTAVLSGIVALIRQKRPQLTPEQIYQVLRSTAVDKGPPGHDDQYGWGVVDPLAALNASAPGGSSAQPPAAATPGPTAGDDSGGGDTLLAVAVVALVWGGGLALVIALIVFLVRRRRRRRASQPLATPTPVGGPPGGPYPPQPPPDDTAWRRPTP